MPWGDGTGPLGYGPMTGRAAGYCAGYPFPGFMNPYVPRMGLRWGRGRGFGRGFGWRMRAFWPVFGHRVRVWALPYMAYGPYGWPPYW